MAPKKTLRQQPGRLFCLFCGSVLTHTKGRLTCTGCRASFIAQDNERGCLVGVELEQCGTPDCCQHRA